MRLTPFGHPGAELSPAPHSSNSHLSSKHRYQLLARNVIEI